MDDNNSFGRRARAVAAIVLVALYIAGLVAMLMSRVQAALILWVVSTLGGIGLLYWIHTMKKRQEDAQKRAGDGTPEEET